MHTYGPTSARVYRGEAQVSMEAVQRRREPAHVPTGGKEALALFAPLPAPVTHGGTKVIAKIPSSSAPRRASIWGVFVISHQAPERLKVT
jgi:hypothetical protein